MSVTLPSPAEYERMSDEVRRSAVEVLHETQAALNAQRARLGAQSVIRSAAMAKAEALVPEFIARHGDTPELQARRQAVLLASYKTTRRAR